jgi:hypothetical protein
VSKVDIFGTVHFDRPQKVQDELQEFARDADVLFSEDAGNQPTPADLRKLFFRNPSIYLMGKAVKWFWTIVSFPLVCKLDSVDSVVTERVADELNIAVIPVDKSMVHAESDVTNKTALISWVWAIIILLVFSSAVTVAVQQQLTDAVSPTLSPVLLALSAFVLAFLPSVSFAQRTLSERNDAIADNIEQFLISKEDADRGCLVVGRGHVSGVKKRLESSEVEVGEIHKSRIFRQSL